MASTSLLYQTYVNCSSFHVSIFKKYHQGTSQLKGNEISTEFFFFIIILIILDLFWQYNYKSDIVHRFVCFCTVVQLHNWYCSLKIQEWLMIRQFIINLSSRFGIVIKMIIFGDDFNYSLIVQSNPIVYHSFTNRMVIFVELWISGNDY